MNTTIPENPQRILIIRLGAIGDVVRTLPALRALRSKFPNAYIAWAVEEGSMDLLEGHSDLDRIFIVRRSKWSKGFLRLPTTLKEIGAFVRELRDDHFDLVLDFHGILKSGVISILSGVPVRVGLSRNFCKEGNYFFNNYHIDLETSALNRIERNIRFIGFLGIARSDYNPIIPVTTFDRELVNHFFNERQLTGRTPLIAIHPGTSNKTLYKRWSLSSYTQLADTLIERFNAHILWTWGPGEKETVEDIVKEMHHESTIAPKVNLRQLAELFRRCHLFVGSDSGPMHIASFVKTPVVVMYGPTDPVVNAPSQSTPNIMLRKDVSCNPCRNRNCSDVGCMSAIKPAEVIAAVQDSLKNRHEKQFHLSYPLS
jgi:lipopolysaccharide heptosyltransferase I